MYLDFFYPECRNTTFLKSYRYHRPVLFFSPLVFLFDENLRSFTKKNISRARRAYYGNSLYSQALRDSLPAGASSRIVFRYFARAISLSPSPPPSFFRSLARSRGRYEFTRKSTIGPDVNSASPASASPFRKRESEREVSCNSLTKWDARARLRLRPPAQLTNPRQRDDEEEAEEEEIRENGAPIVEIAPCIDVTVRIT